jgi:SnoaL-like domain
MSRAPGAMSDVELIRDVIARNNQYLDDRRYEDCSHTFTADGRIGPHQGRAAILEFMHSQGLGAQPDLRRRHVVTNIVIELHDDEAQVASDLILYDKVGDDGAWAVSAVGRYADTLARQSDGTWLFSHRQLTFL